MCGAVSEHLGIGGYAQNAPSNVGDVRRYNSRMGANELQSRWINVLFIAALVGFAPCEFESYSIAIE